MSRACRGGGKATQFSSRAAAVGRAAEQIWAETAQPWTGDDPAQRCRGEGAAHHPREPCRVEALWGLWCPPAHQWKPQQAPHRSRVCPSKAWEWGKTTARLRLGLGELQGGAGMQIKGLFQFWPWHFELCEQPEPRGKTSSRQCGNRGGQIWRTISGREVFWQVWGVQQDWQIGGGKEYGDGEIFWQSGCHDWRIYERTWAVKLL